MKCEYCDETNQIETISTPEGPLDICPIHIVDYIIYISKENPEAKYQLDMGDN